MEEAVSGVDILFVCAAGNSGENIDASPVYPAACGCANVIAVASMNEDGNLSGFSNYGTTSVDVAAPGEEIISTLPGGSYGRMSGTSMAVTLRIG